MRDGMSVCESCGRLTTELAEYDGRRLCERCWTAWRANGSWLLDGRGAAVRVAGGLVACVAGAAAITWGTVPWCLLGAVLGVGGLLLIDRAAKLL